MKKIIVCAWLIGTIFFSYAMNHLKAQEVGKPLVMETLTCGTVQDVKDTLNSVRDKTTVRELLQSLKEGSTCRYDSFPVVYKGYTMWTSKEGDVYNITQFVSEEGDRYSWHLVKLATAM